jgi:hypothetical protein
MRVEYAKDVQLQTPRYRTSQENTAWYLHDHLKHLLWSNYGESRFV